MANTTPELVDLTTEDPDNEICNRVARSRPISQRFRRRERANRERADSSDVEDITPHNNDPIPTRRLEEKVVDLTEDADGDVSIYRVPINVIRIRSLQRARNNSDGDVSIDLTHDDSINQNPVKYSRMSRPISPPSPPRAPELKCPICIDTYVEIKKNGLKIVVTRCGHMFCDSCLKKALTENGRKCPKCRKNVPKGATGIIEIFDVA